MKKSLWIGLLLVVLLLAAVPAFAQDSTCVGERVIDANPETWLSDESVNTVDRVLQSLDRFGVQFFFYIVNTDAVIAGKSTDVLAQELINAQRCGVGVSSIVITIAPGIDPFGPLGEAGLSIIVYEVDAVHIGQLRINQDEIVMNTVAREIHAVLENTEWTLAELVAALEGIGPKLDLALHPVAELTPTQVLQPVPTVAPISTAVAQVQPTLENTKAFELNVDAFLFLVMMGLSLVIVVLIFWSVFLYINERRLKAENAEKRRQKDKQEAMTLQGVVHRLITSWMQRKPAVEKSVNELLVVASEKKPLLEKLAEAVALVAEGLNLYDGMTGENYDLTIEQSSYREILSMLLDVQDWMTPALELLKEVEQEREQLAGLIKSAPTLLDEIGTQIDGYVLRIKVVADQGFDTATLADVIPQAKAQLAAAREALSNKRYTKAVELANAAREAAEEAALQAEELLKLKQSYLEQLDALRRKAEEVDLAIKLAQTAQNLLEQHPPSAWHDVKGNTGEAQNRLSWGVQNINDILDAVNDQQWQVADREHTQAQGWFAEAEALLDAVIARQGQIDKAQSDAPDVIAEVTRNLGSLNDIIDVNKPTVNETTHQKAGEFSVRLKQLEDLLVGNTPDYLGIVRSARELASLASVLAGRINKDADTLARLRRNITSQMEEANRSVERAEAYQQVHREDIDAESEDLLAKATRNLRDARNQHQELDLAEGLLSIEDYVEELEGVIALLTKADEYADDALESMKHDVAEKATARNTYYSSTYVSSSPVSRRDQNDDDRKPFSWGTTNTMRPSATASSFITRPSVSRPSVASSFVTRATPSISRPSAPATRPHSKR